MYGKFVSRCAVLGTGSDVNTITAKAIIHLVGPVYSERFMFGPDIPSTSDGSRENPEPRIQNPESRIQNPTNPDASSFPHPFSVQLFFFPRVSAL